MSVAQKYHITEKVEEALQDISKTLNALKTFFPIVNQWQLFTFLSLWVFSTLIIANLGFWDFFIVKFSEFNSLSFFFVQLCLKSFSLVNFWLLSVFLVIAEKTFNTWLNERSLNYYHSFQQKRHLSSFGHLKIIN